MKIRIFFTVIAVGTIVAFAALNWSTIMMETTLSLGVATVEAPLGFVILGLLAMFTLSFTVFVIYSKASGFLRACHQTREIKARQELQDNDEGLNFDELRGLLGLKLERQADLYSGLTAKMLVRLEQLDGVLRSVTKELGHTYSAPVGSMHLKNTEGMVGNSSDSNSK